MPVLNVRDNLLLPLRLAHRKVDRGHFDEVVETLGLGGRLRHLPHELSGGQRQRVAFGRAGGARQAGGDVRGRADRQPRQQDRHGGTSAVPAACGRDGADPHVHHPRRARGILRRQPHPGERRGGSFRDTAG